MNKRDWADIDLTVSEAVRVAIREHEYSFHMGPGADAPWVAQWGWDFDHEPRKSQAQNTPKSRKSRTLGG